MFLRSRRREQRSDEALFSALRSGDAQALAVLWDRYAHLLFGISMKYLRESERSKDMVLELFAELPVLASRYEVRSFGAWVHQVMRNRCLMSLRGERQEVMSDEGIEQMEQDDEGGVLHEASLQRLEAALEHIDHAQRRCIRSFYYDRLSYERIAERERLSVEQVRSHLQNGRRMLRSLLTGKSNTEDHGTH